MSIYEAQKKVKPEIEEMVPEFLSGAKKELALDFTAFLRSLKMKPAWASANSWKASYKGKGVCYVRLRDGYFSVSPYVDFSKEFEAYAEKEGLKEIIWNNLTFCRRCNPKSCAARLGVGEDTFSGIKKTFIGREFEGVCVNSGVHFRDPGEAEIACARKLIDFRRGAIDGNAVAKVKYMSHKRRISITEIVVLEHDIKVTGLSLEKAGWPMRIDKIGELWGVYSDAHRARAVAKLPVTEYGFFFEKPGGCDYIAGSEVSGFRDTGDEQISSVIPAGRYIKDTFNAFDFEELVADALQKRNVRKWASENGAKIKNMPPYPVASIEVYPVQEMSNPEGAVTNETFKRDGRIKAKFPVMYTLTPIE